MKINKNLPERKHNGVLQIPLSEKSKKKNQKEKKSKRNYEGGSSYFL